MNSGKVEEAGEILSQDWQDIDAIIKTSESESEKEDLIRIQVKKYRQDEFSAGLL